MKQAKVSAFGLSPTDIKSLSYNIDKVSEGVFSIYINLPNRRWEFTSHGSDGDYNCIIHLSNEAEGKDLSFDFALPDTQSGCLVGQVCKNYFMGFYVDYDAYSNAPTILQKNRLHIRSKPSLYKETGDDSPLS